MRGLGQEIVREANGLDNILYTLVKAIAPLQKKARICFAGSVCREAIASMHPETSRNEILGN